MNGRKQHVIEKAHQLFIDKGFHATSIQEILEFSGISKGTFYNYFQSKNELLMAIFRTTFIQMDMERDNLLRGQDPADPDIFIKQIELQMKKNRENKLILLFEEVFFSHDKEMKDFLERGQLKSLRWVHDRLRDLFSEEYHPFLLDAAIMLKGVLQQNIRHYTLAHGPNTSLSEVVRFSVSRIIQMVHETFAAGEQLLNPSLLEQWLPSSCEDDLAFKKRVTLVITTIKKQDDHTSECSEKLDFILDELLHERTPRKFLIDSVLASLKTAIDSKQLAELEEVIQEKLLKQN